MLERLKQMIVHLTTVVPNWQSRPWFAPSYLRISSIASQSTQSVGDTSIDLAFQRFTACTKLAPKCSRFAQKCDTILRLHDACLCQDKKSYETRYVGLHFRACLHKWRWIGRGPKGHQEPTALQWPNPKPTLSVRTGVTYGYGYLFS